MTTRPLPNALENIYTGVDEDDYPSAKDFMEARGGGLADDASAKHYEHFEIASKFSGYGDEATQLDPDGDFTGGSYAANSHWPWLSRNARLPRYIANPSAPLANFAYIYRNRKPTAFDMIAVENYQNGAGWDGNNPWSFPDKGVYAVDETPAFDARASNYIYDIDSNGGYRYDENHLAPYSFQMNHKNGNFEQIGEVLNVWTHAHMISQPYRDYGIRVSRSSSAARSTCSAQTLRTFSESLSKARRDPRGRSWSDLVQGAGRCGLPTAEESERIRTHLNGKPTAISCETPFGESVDSRCRPMPTDASSSSENRLAIWPVRARRRCPTGSSHGYCNTDLSHLGPSSRLVNGCLICSSVTVQVSTTSSTTTATRVVRS